MAEAEPPFADIQDPRQLDVKWPPLSRPEIYTRPFHEFLRLCSQPASSRPDPGDLSEVRSSCFVDGSTTEMYFFLRLHSSGTLVGDR